MAVVVLRRKEPAVDGVSDPGEVRPLSAHGVVSLTALPAKTQPRQRLHRIRVDGSYVVGGAAPIVSHRCRDADFILIAYRG